MSTNISDFSPQSNSGPHSPLLLTVDQQPIEIPPAALHDQQYRQQLFARCAAAISGPPVFVIGGLLDWADDDRWLALRLIASVANAQVKIAVAAAETFNLFDAVVGMLVDASDVVRGERSRQAAIQAAALVHSSAPLMAANRIADRMREVGVRGVLVPAIAKEIRQWVTSLSAITAREQGGQHRLLDIFPEVPVPELTVVPIGWRFDAAGISRIDSNDPSQIVPTAVVISRRLHNIDDGTEAVELTFLREGHWKPKIVNRAAVASTHEIVKLADIGLPVTTNNAKTLVQFLGDFEAQNIDILPVSRITGRLGWVAPDGSEGFIWGRALLRGSAGDPAHAQEILFAGADLGEEQIAAGFHAAGTREGWQRAIRPLAAFPRVRFGVYAGLSPALLDIVGAENFCVSYAGSTSQGKTSALRVIASAWGCPRERSAAAVMHTWDSTRVFISGAAAVQNSLPLIVDDTKRARFTEAIAQILYDVASGRDRGRGSVAGLRPSHTYSTVMITSGEESIIGFSEDGGTRARVFEFLGSPFGEANAMVGAMVNELNRGVLENFGHAGPEFVEYLWTHRDSWPAWKTHYQRLCERLQRRAGSNPVARRLAQHLALVRLTAILAHSAGILPWDYCDVTAELWAELMAEAPDADRGRAALLHVIYWAQSRARDFFDVSNASLDPPSQGWTGRWDYGRLGQSQWQWLGFFPPRLKEILVAAGFTADSIIRAWNERGWLRSDPDGRLQLRTHVDGKATRVTAITRASIEEVMGHAETTEGQRASMFLPPPVRGNGTGVGRPAGTPN